MKVVNPLLRLPPLTLLAIFLKSTILSILSGRLGNPNLVPTQLIPSLAFWPIALKGVPNFLTKLVKALEKFRETSLKSCLILSPIFKIISLVGSSTLFLNSWTNPPWRFPSSPFSPKNQFLNFSEFTTVPIPAPNIIFPTSPKGPPKALAPKPAIAPADAPGIAALNFAWSSLDIKPPWRSPFSSFLPNKIFDLTVPVNINAFWDIYPIILCNCSNL